MVALLFPVLMLYFHSDKAVFYILYKAPALFRKFNHHIVQIKLTDTGLFVILLSVCSALGAASNSSVKGSCFYGSQSDSGNDPGGERRASGRDRADPDRFFYPSGQEPLYQVGKPAEDRFVQDPRRLQQDPQALPRGGREGRDRLLRRQPCAGRGPVRDETRHQVRDLHARGRSPAEGRGHPRLRRGGRARAGRV